jgi:RNA polymerase sigma factor (sigma-70 family)
VTEALPRLDEPGDAELISAVRGGDVSAYAGLFERHVSAARRLARQLVGPADADDLVSDAYMKVLRVLQNGGGPDVAFRAYLLTAVRRLHVDKIRAGSKLHSTDDMDAFDPGVPFRDTAVEGFENAAAAKAFASLPERWQLVLWHTEVEGQKPAEVAALLGMSPNSVSALAYRAREGLRQEFLNSHAADAEDGECSWTHDHLGAYIRNGVSKRDAGKVEKHLDECRRCMAIYLELTEVNSNLGAILAPLLLGGAGMGYLASAGGAAVKGGGLLLLFDRAKDAVTSNGQAAAVAGVAAATVVAGATFAMVTGGDDGESPAAAPPSQSAPSDSAPPASPPSAPPAQKPSKAPSRTAAPPPVQPQDEPADAVSMAVEEPATRAPAETSAPTDEPPAESAGPRTSAPDTSAPPTSQPPTSQPPTSSPPTTQPPPSYDLTVDVSVAPPRGHTYHFSATTRGYAPDGRSRLVITWSGMKPPKSAAGCTVGDSQIVCPLSAADPNVAEMKFIANVVGVRPSITATVSATNFKDADGSNNSDRWEGLLNVDGVHVGDQLLDTVRP